MGLVRGAVRHYCLCGCSALAVCARRSRPVPGDGGRCRVLRLPRFPLSAPRFLRCVWRAIPSGCPLCSLAGTPFHAVCAFRGLGPVALLVFPACPLCVCALALLRRLRPPPPLPGLVWRAHLARSRCWALVGPFHGVCAPLCVLPRCRAPFGLLGGGGGPVPFPPTWLGAARSPWGGCGRGDPSPTPPRALLGAGFARCGVGTRAPGNGALCLGVRRGGVCSGWGFGSAPPLLAGVLGCVCACVRAPPVPRHSWLRCPVWVCVFGFGFRLRPATPGWAVGVFVCLCARSACTPPLLARWCGVGVCAWARVSAAPRHPWQVCWGLRVCGRAPLVPRHSWLRCAVWVCVCLGSGFGCAPPLLAGVLG